MREKTGEMIHTKPTGISYLRPRWRFASAKDGSLHIENTELAWLAQRFGTPFYLIVESAIKSRLTQFKTAFSGIKFRPQYAIKCNSNIEILKTVKEEGFEADASSTGEIILALLAGFAPDQITLTNLYKSEKDLMLAARIGVKAITIDSIEELNRAISTAKTLDVPMRIFIRINPKIEEGEYSTTNHHYGIPIDEARDAITLAAHCENVQLTGIHWHGGYVPSPHIYTMAAKKLIPLLSLAKSLGCPIEYLDLGGGFPVEYNDAEVFTPEDVARTLIPTLENELQEHGLDNITLIHEPGKYIVANAGIGVMKVVSVKDLGTKKKAIVDGSTYAMLPDPLTWDVKYNILPAGKMTAPSDQTYDIHGLTCDCWDKIRKDATLPTLQEGDIIAVMDCGAYSNVMASNFNTLKRPQMLMIREDGTVQTIRRSDRYSEIFAAELEVAKPTPGLKAVYNLIRNAAKRKDEVIREISEN